MLFVVITIDLHLIFLAIFQKSFDAVSICSNLVLKDFVGIVYVTYFDKLYLIDAAIQIAWSLFCVRGTAMRCNTSLNFRSASSISAGVNCLSMDIFDAISSLNFV